VPSLVDCWKTFNPRETNELGGFLHELLAPFLICQFPAGFRGLELNQLSHFDYDFVKIQISPHESPKLKKPNGFLNALRDEYSSFKADVCFRVEALWPMLILKK
jgi:hypothetical protein